MVAHSEASVQSGEGMSGLGRTVLLMLAAVLAAVLVVRSNSRSPFDLESEGFVGQIERLLDETPSSSLLAVQLADGRVINVQHDAQLNAGCEIIRNSGGAVPLPADARCAIFGERDSDGVVLWSRTAVVDVRGAFPVGRLVDADDVQATLRVNLGQGHSRDMFVPIASTYGSDGGPLGGSCPSTPQAIANSIFGIGGRDGSNLALLSIGSGELVTVACLPGN